MLQTEIAVLRFGLGARPGDLTAATGDPRSWLRAQTQGEVQLAGMTSLAPSEQIFAEVLAAREERRDLKREAAAQPDTDSKAALNVLREAYLPHYRAQVLARHSPNT